MAGVTIKKHIEASPEEVFAAATDLNKWVERIRGIEKVELLTDGPLGVGTRFRETRIMFKREAIEEMEFTGFDPPNGYAVGCESHGCRYNTEFSFTPNGSGTDVEMRFEATPLTFVAKAMSAMMKPMLGSVGKVLEQDLDDLKAAIEV